MTQQVINIGAAPDDATGDPLRLSFDKTNENFTELYAKGATEGLWNYNKTSTDTTTAPVSGRFKTNSGDYRGATQIAINAITIQGIDRSSTLRTLLVGDLVQCQDSTNSAAWCRYSLQSLPVDHGTWFQLNVTFQTDGGVASGDNQEIVFVFTASSGSAGAGAPVGAEYITAAADPTLTAERVLTNTATITWDFSTAGQAKASAAGGGNVSNSGTPTVGQYGKWVTATTIQGVAPATVLSDIGAQPLDADLTAIAALTGTNVIYYRSAANTWAAITIGAGLTFTGGTLAASGFAPLASPAFTGNPTAPTPINSDADTSIATTAFVRTGTATNDNAAAGQVGEVIEAATLDVIVATGTVVAIASITLTPGDWDVWAGFYVDGAAANAQLWVTISAAATNTVNSPGRVTTTYAQPSGVAAISVGPYRQQVAAASSLTLYANVYNPSGASATADATITARRMR